MDMDERYNSIAERLLDDLLDSRGREWAKARVIVSLAEAVAEERERCAKVCEDIGRKELSVSKPALWAACCADAIRRAP